MQPVSVARPLRALWAAILVALGGLAQAVEVPKDLPLPEGEPSPLEVARQVYFANHFYAFRNFSIRKRGRTMPLLITRDGDGRVSHVGLERHLNNAYSPGDAIVSRDLAVFQTGKLRGVGMLVTDFREEGKSQSYEIWMPQLRRVRRFAQPDHDELWGGSVFTFGDVTLRKPGHETHELLGRKPFRTCLGVIDELEGEFYERVDRLPDRACRHVGKEVYGLKSTTRFENWWYDYRISFVDTESFADYRTAYYKDGDLIKVIDRDWGRVTGGNKRDPRALFWKSWYGLDLRDGRESWAIIPQQVVAFDTPLPNRFWSQRTLRRIRR